MGGTGAQHSPAARKRRARINRRSALKLGLHGMIENKVEIKTPDGAADGFFYQPEFSGTWPGVVMHIDIFGVRPTFQDMAKKLAAEGYAVLLPNLFYRKGPAALKKLKFEKGSDMMDLIHSFTPDIVRKDATAYVDFLGRQKAVKSGAMGTVGYCFSGALAMRMACARPDRIGACASFHGGWLATESPDSPHKLLPKAKARFYFSHASDDSSCPPDMIDRLEAALDAAHLQYESEVYPAKHGFAVKDHDNYDAEACEKHWRKMFALFAETLR